MMSLPARIGSTRRRWAVLFRVAICGTLVAVWTQAPAESFGRLFFTPDERRTLNDMRTDDIEPVQPVEQGPTKAVAPVVDVISFDGKVERSGGGATTIWVNGRPVYTGDQTVEGIRIQSDRGTSAQTRFVLPPSDAGETDFSLKVGQKIAVQSGKVLEPYESRAAEDAESVFDEETADQAKPAEGEAASTDGGDPKATTGGS